jgi:hypothetical protein
MKLAVRSGVSNNTLLQAHSEGENMGKIPVFSITKDIIV